MSSTDRSWAANARISIVRYRASDRDRCLHVFDSNVPAFFAAHERGTFTAFLAQPPGPFWVARQPDGAVLGCGGVSLADERRTTWLRWGMVHAAHHHQGIGRRLLQERLRWAGEQPSVQTVRVATTERVRAFFEQMGFAVTAVTDGGFGSGVDRYDLELEVGGGTR